MRVIGITGGIASGKSTITDMFNALGFRSLDVDKAVHSLYKESFVIEAIANLVPQSVQNGAINRNILSKYIEQDSELLDEIEHLIHPLIRLRQKEFLSQHNRYGIKTIIIEHPLAIETGAIKWFDQLIVTKAPMFKRKQRAFKRHAMTEDKWRMIINKQLSDVQRCRVADHIIYTGLNKAHSYQQVKMLAKYLRGDNQ